MAKEDADVKALETMAAEAAPPDMPMLWAAHWQALGVAQNVAPRALYFYAGKSEE